MRVVVTVLLLATLVVFGASVARAADAADVYISGYAAAILEREFARARARCASRAGWCH